MIESLNARAWQFLCARWRDGSHWFDEAIETVERPVLEHLVAIRAVKPFVTDNRFVLCPCCGLQVAELYRACDVLELNCTDCGPVRIFEGQLRAWAIDADWFIRKLRSALDTSARQASLVIASGIWLVGQHERRSVILARSLDEVLHYPAVLERPRGNQMPWVITPKPRRDTGADPLSGRAQWLPLEERFTLYGGNISFIEPGTAPELSKPDPSTAVHGPFSEDFRWVHLTELQSDPIALTLAQAAVFRSLWHFAGQPQEAHTIMSRAGCSSDKPIDVFKVKPKFQGDPKYELPLQAYKALVQTDRRAGTYVMPCAALTTA